MHTLKKEDIKKEYKIIPLQLRIIQSTLLHKPLQYHSLTFKISTTDLY
jgi:hypothetical protein